MSNKVLAFKILGRKVHNTLNDDLLEEPLSIEEEEAFAGKARNVLNDRENLRVTNHGAVELRDKMHLLRYSLNKMRRQSIENNINNK